MPPSTTIWLGMHLVLWTMLAVKVIRQKHEASADILRLLDEFRRMVNI